MGLAYDSPMPRKPRTSFLEDVYDTAKQLPWWASIVLAGLSFAMGHMLAGTRTANPRTPEAIVTPVVVALGRGELAGHFEMVFDFPSRRLVAA